MSKLKCYLTSPVFREIANHPKVSVEKKKEIIELWEKLGEVSSELRVSDTRFPSEEEITDNIQNWGAQIVGCHLSHPITSEMLKDSEVMAVCTSTSGYNHIAQEPGILITHTPGVLHRTVADFTIAAILANLRNVVGLHNYVWDEKWKSGQKWDLDENLSSTIDNLTLGIVGMGEIGKELTKRLYPWGIKIQYYDVRQQEEFEEKYPNIQFESSLENIFTNSDIVTLHVPLMNTTHHLVSEKLLKLMKKGSLLVNTARGPVVDFDVLLSLLENKEIQINLAFDVFEQEPIDIPILKRFKKIADSNQKLKFIFVPHNASADADTRAEMAIMLLSDILTLSTANSGEDLSSIRLIPEQKSLQNKEDYKNFKIAVQWSC